MSVIRSDEEMAAAVVTSDAAATVPPDVPKKRGRKSEVRVREEDADYSHHESEDENSDNRKKQKHPHQKEAITGNQNQRGIMANSDAALRRRDRIKRKDRYSPPPVPSRDRRKASFPSTYSRASTTTTAAGEKKGNRIGKPVKTCPIDVQREGDGSKMLITLPDGTTYRVDATPVTGKSRRGTGANPLDDDTEDEDVAIIETGIDDPDDDDYEPTYGQMRRIKDVQPVKKTAQRRTAAGSNSIVKVIARQPRPSSAHQSKDEMKTTAIKSTTNTGETRVTYVAAPKAITLTYAVRQPPKRNYGIQAKFIEDLPELSDCTGEVYDESVKYDKIPDTMLLINSDLPLQYCTTCTTTTSLSTSSSSPPASSSLARASSLSAEKPVYAFRQILSPHSPTYPCLLCPHRNNSAATSRSEGELRAHYSMIHELQVEVGMGKVSDDVIHVCLSEANLRDLEQGQDVVVDTYCQYCEGVLLHTLSSLKQHYEGLHMNRVELISQEVILKMHEHLYCYECDEESFSDLKSLNHHMRSRHRLQTYPCRSCSFFTQDEVRLKSHFKAKHMLNSSGTRGSQSMQCTECAFCNGLLLGSERMSRHIMTAHCIQTAVGQYSCVKCLSLAGPQENLISHSTRCPAIALGQDQDPEATGQATEVDGAANTASQPFGCFLCEKVFSSAASCQLHLDHTHTQWVERESPVVDPVRLEDLPSLRELQAAGIKAAHGFYCGPCDAVIDQSVYPLFYLHMCNVHNRHKVFQCKVSSCSQRFNHSDDLLQHMNISGHPQASVMQDTLGAICCHFCDMYFKDRREFELHHLTDQHADKIPSTSSTKYFVASAGRQEARNWKCKTCHTWFGLTDSFVYHMEHETHKHACPYCGIDFALPSSRRTHIQSHHQEKTDFCEVCGEKQGSKERVVAHLVHHDIVFECDTCMKKFYQREQLNSHSESHGPPVQCHWTGCHKKVNPASLTAHVKQHRIEKNSKCLECNKVFPSKAQLEAHREIHAKAEISARAILSSQSQQQQPQSATYLLEQPDGQMIQISCPVGVDINDVLNSLQLQPTLPSSQQQEVLPISLTSDAVAVSLEPGTVAVAGDTDDLTLMGAFTNC